MNRNNIGYYAALTFILGLLLGGFAMKNLHECEDTRRETDPKKQMKELKRMYKK